jgi:hypothetical protein
MRIVRHTYPFKTTLGTWFLPDGRPFCFTLEDEVRDGGIIVPKETAVFDGLHTLELSMSPKFGRELPHIYSATIPANRGIRCHRGKNDESTDGCVIVGFELCLDPPMIGASKEAEVALVEILRSMPGKKTSIEIVQVNR